MNKTIQYLSLKDDKRKFRSASSKNIYKENESIILDAQLYNENYESINDPEVNVTVTDAAGKEYNYIMNRTQDFYALKPVVFQSSKTQSIMHLRWLFFVLAGLLILEWFIRRYMGSY